MTLIALVESWENQARKCFYDAEQPESAFEKQYIESRAMQYYARARELREIIGIPLPSPSASLKEKLKKRRRQV